MNDEATSTKGMAKTGSCYNCSNPIPMTDNFCDFDCQQAYLRQVEYVKGKAWWVI